MLHDYKCTGCKLQTEKYVTVDTMDSQENTCPQCKSILKRIPSAPKISYLRMGVDQDFPTAGDRWAKIHEDGAKKEESPNLIHI
jgi:putative FmdB family regulatory protein